EEAQREHQSVQERDLRATETELEADRARLDAQYKTTEAEQERSLLSGVRPRRTSSGPRSTRSVMLSMSVSPRRTGSIPRPGVARTPPVRAARRTAPARRMARTALSPPPRPPRARRRGPGAVSTAGRMRHLRGTDGAQPARVTRARVRPTPTVSRRRTPSRLSGRRKSIRKVIPTSAPEPR